MDQFNFDLYLNYNSQDGNADRPLLYGPAYQFQDPDWHTNQIVNDYDHAILPKFDWNIIGHTNFLEDNYTEELPTQLASTGIENLDHVNYDPETTVPSSACGPEPDTVRSSQNIPPLSGLSTSRPTEILKQWAAQNSDVLYPTNETKGILSTRTGLTIKQISTWFANYRQRSVKKAQIPSIRAEYIAHTPQQNDPTDSLHEAVWHDNCNLSFSTRASSHRVVPSSSPQRPLSDCQIDHCAAEHTQDTDNERIATHLRAGLDLIASWHLTLPEDDRYDHIEGHQENDLTVGLLDLVKEDNANGDWKIGPIRTAADMISEHNIRVQPASEPRDRSKRSSSRGDRSSTRSVRRKMSVGSTESRLEGYDGASATSFKSSASGVSYRSSTSRRGRRMQQGTHSSNKQHHCSECGQGFGRRSDMTRHIKAIHNRDQAWVCRPIRRRLCMRHIRPCSMDNKLLCLCDSDPQTCGHKMLQCWAKLQNERTFHRLDNFRGHLRDTHRLDHRTVANIDTTRFELDPYTTTEFIECYHQEEGLFNRKFRRVLDIFKSKN